MAQAPEVKKPAAIAPDGSLVYTSVSAVKKYRTCAAAWFYRYKLRRKDESGPGARESTKMHAEVEHYLKTGENVLGEIPRRALARGLFPKPNEPKNPRADDLMLEAELEGLDSEGVPFIVKVDCIDPRRVASEGLLVINDWKFKKDIGAYGTSEEALRDPEHPEGDGLQMVGYAEAVRRLIVEKGWFPGTNTIRLRHVQVDKRPASEIKGLDAEEVFTDLSLADSERIWLTVSPYLRGMKEVAKADSVESVPATKGSACWKFGGCAFKAECPHFNGTANRASRLKALFKPKHLRASVALEETNEMGMLSKMKTAAPAVTPPPAAPVQAAPTPTPAPAPTPKPSLIIDESQVPDAVLKANPNVGKPVAAVLPPDAPVPQKVVAGVSPAPQVSAPAAAPASNPAEPMPQESVKPHRGRPTKAELEARKAAQTRKAAQAPAVEPAPTPEAHPAGEGFSIWVGCSPRKLTTTSLQPYVDALEKQTLQAFRENLKDASGKPLDLDDIRLSEGPDVGFSKWKAVFAGIAKENPPPPGNYHVLGLGIDDRIDVVVGALEGLALEVHTR
jgi:hypothetical protein